MSPVASIDALVRMVNQIAANVSHEAPDVAAAHLAGHLNSFWASSMRAELCTYVSAGGVGLHPIASDAVSKLRFRVRSNP